MSLTLINHTSWPTPALFLLVEWAARREKLDCHENPYGVQIDEVDPLSRPIPGTYLYAKDCLGIAIPRHTDLERRWPQGFCYALGSHKLTHFRCMNHLEAVIFLLVTGFSYSRQLRPLPYVKYLPGMTPRPKHEVTPSRIIAYRSTLKAFRKDWPILKARIAAKRKAGSHPAELQNIYVHETPWND